jgi:hypothetical protein
MVLPPILEWLIAVVSHWAMGSPHPYALYIYFFFPDTKEGYIKNKK